MKITTIDINAKEWFDKANGNSYFASRVTLNYGTKNEKTIALPYQYGYGDSYGYESMKELVRLGLLPKPEKEFALVPWRYAQETGIIIRTSKQERCKKRELVEFGTL